MQNKMKIIHTNGNSKKSKSKHKALKKKVSIKKVSIKKIKEKSKSHTSRKYRSEDTFWHNLDIVSRMREFPVDQHSVAPTVKLHVDPYVQTPSWSELPSDVIKEIISHIHVEQQITRPEVEKVLNLLIQQSRWRVLSTWNSQKPFAMTPHPSSIEDVNFHLLGDITIITRCHRPSTTIQAYDFKVAPYINSKLFNQYLDRLRETETVETLKWVNIYDQTIAFITQTLNGVLGQRELSRAKPRRQNETTTGFVRDVEKRLSLIHQTLLMLDDNNILIEFTLGKWAGDKIKNWKSFKDGRLRREEMRREVEARIRKREREREARIRKGNRGALY